METDRFQLIGLDGSNPLAFLAAVGALRSLSLGIPDSKVSMRWIAEGRWVPELHVSPALTRDELIERLHRRMVAMRGHDAFSFANNLSVPRTTFRIHCEQAAGQASPSDRTSADFACGFGSDVLETDTEPPVIQDTAFRTMSGAGHQHFLTFFRNIAAATEPHHLKKALFETWRYDDPLSNHTTRWDPQEDVRYALRWSDPSGEGNIRSRSGGVLGANRLAIEAIPVFPCQPVKGRLETSGFRGRKSSDTALTWPIWDVPIGLDVVRTLLASTELQEDQPDRTRLRQRGVAETYRSMRITVGKYRNFTPARSV